MLDREAKIEAIRSEMLVFIDEIAEHFEKERMFGPQSAYWITIWPERMLNAVEQVERSREFAQ